MENNLTLLTKESSHQSMWMCMALKLLQMIKPSYLPNETYFIEGIRQRRSHFITLKYLTIFRAAFFAFGTISTESTEHYSNQDFYIFVFITKQIFINRAKLMISICDLSFDFLSPRHIFIPVWEWDIRSKPEMFRIFVIEETSVFEIWLVEFTL